MLEQNYFSSAIFEVENVVEKTMTGQNVDVFLLKSKETQVKSLKIVNLDNINTFV